MITCFREWPTALAPLRGASGEFEARLPAGERLWYGSGRAALFDLLGTLGLEPGAEVLMPAYIAAGVIDPVRAQGLRPRFYPTGADLLLDEGAVMDAAGRGARAVIVLHPMGRPQKIERLAGFCRERGVALIEDCAQGLFSRDLDGRPLGSRGDAALFSLPKFLGTVDGAVLVLRGRAAPQRPRRRHAAARAAGAWHRAHLLANRCLHEASQPALCDVLLGASGFFHERYYALAGADFRPAPPAASTLAAASRLDVEGLVRRRRANVERLYAGLKSPALRLVYPRDLPGWVPLAVPAFVLGRERASVQAEARRRGVLLASLSQRWDYIPAGEAAAFAAERAYLDSHVLIPINEHIDDARMERVVQTLNDL